MNQLITRTLASLQAALNWSLANGTKVLGGGLLAVIALYYSVENYRVARANLQRQSRASVGVSQMSFSFDADHRGRTIIDVKNTGPGVANHYAIAIQPEMFALPPDVFELNQDAMKKLRPIQEALPTPPESGVIMPGDTRHEISVVGRPLTLEQYANVMSGRMYFINFGKILYSDPDGSQHVTMYCGYFDPRLAGAEGYRGSTCGDLNSMN